MKKNAHYRSIFGVFCAVLLLAGMVGCATPKPVVSENTSNTLIEREKVDSLIGVAADSARAHLALACDSMGNVYIAEINTLQGERTRLEIALRAALESPKTNVHNKQSTPAAANTTPAAAGNATPAKPKIVYLDVDCAADSLQILVTKLRERITHMEQNKEKETVVEKVVPDYYRNCTRGFWVLLIIVILVFVWCVADYIPVLSKYKLLIKGLFKFL
jgi:hypothetical protein